MMDVFIFPLNIYKFHHFWKRKTNNRHFLPIFILVPQLNRLVSVRLQLYEHRISHFIRPNCVFTWHPSVVLVLLLALMVSPLPLGTRMRFKVVQLFHQRNEKFTENVGARGELFEWGSLISYGMCVLCLVRAIITFVKVNRLYKTCTYAQTYRTYHTIPKTYSQCINILYILVGVAAKCHPKFIWSLFR